MTTSLTWTCSSCVRCVGCGIDSEHIDRFVQWENAPLDFFPFVFTKKEKSHCKTLVHPAIGLCASFCTKEALQKVLPEPYNFTDCEFFYSDDPQKCKFSISRQLASCFPDISYTVKILSGAFLEKKAKHTRKMSNRTSQPLWTKNHMTAIVHAFKAV